jgi:phenylpyruvate tautomerase PptA (4-oxalocrotonate tautomerase family)
VKTDWIKKMPTIQITLTEDYTPAIREDLSRRLTAAAQAATGVGAGEITVVLDKIPGSGNGHASQTVRAYLTAMEALDYETSGGLLAKGFTMTFPGDVRFTTPQELADWGRQRYRSVKKSFEYFDELNSGGVHVVYCFGTLYGEWSDGTPFSGVRFIDRFTIKDGLLTDQRVWNDLAESRR